MWPFSDSGSHVIGVPNKPKIHVDLTSFAESDKALDVSLTADIWSMVEWLSVVSDSTHIDVVRALLFRALYGHVAYELLLDHVREHRRAEALREAEWIAELSRTNAENGDAEIRHSDNIRKSTCRSTSADLEHIGKSNVQRKLWVPKRMWLDLDRQASKAGTDLSRYVRSLLFRELQGEVNYNQWQYARAELEDRVKPPSTR